MYKKILLFFLLQVFKGQEYVSNIQEFCKSVDLDEWQLTEEEILSKRSSSINILKPSFSAIAEFFGSQNSAAIFNAISILIIPIILMVIALGSFIFYILFFFVCKEAQVKSTRKVKILWFIQMFLGIFFFAFFMVFLIFSIKVNKNSDEGICALSQIPYQLLLGASQDSYEFMGITYLIQFFEQFEEDLGNISDTTSYFGSIYNLNLNTYSKDGFVYLTNFLNSYSSSTIIDGNGEQNKPIVVENINTTYQQMYNDFYSFGSVADSAHNAAQYGRTLTTSSLQKVLNDNVESAVDYLDSISDDISSPMNNMARGVRQFGKRLVLFFALILIFSILCIISLLSMTLISCYQTYKASCFQLKIPLKILLAFSGLCSFFIACGCFLSTVIAGSVGSTCGQIESVLTSSTPGDSLTQAGLILNTNTTAFINICVPDNTNSTFKDLMTNFTNGQTLLNGMTALENFTYNITSATENMPTAAAKNSLWVYYKNGYYPNFQNVVTSLTNLNNQISCDDQQIVLNSLNCTSSASLTCTQIESVTTPYDPPSCVTSEKDTYNYFNYLSQYFEANSALMSDMMTDIYSSSQTPNQGYKDMVAQLKTALTYHSSIKSSFSSTLNLASKFQSGFTSFADCGATRNIIQNLEYGLCFKNNTNTFMYFIGTFGMSLIMIIVNILMLFIIRNIDYDNSFQKLDDSSVISEKNQN